MAHVTMITLGVSDLERATSFYTALGWERSSASVPGTVTFLHGTTAALALFGRDDLAEDAGVTLAGPETTGAIALAMNLPDRASVDAAVAAARRAGATVTKPPTAAEWGGYSGYVRDPDGHLWEIAHNPSFPLRDDGGVELPRA